ncbi:pyridoxal-5'-phosphate dependent enzyme family [Legionella wadsworthii]|uniref:Pyridoxal phosphate homeostasis protein n=1 Tax=Legionella wadsworthii TaxID=28088 RepID=A0A378LSG1_9GAMM|nr:YggS family pyridoxal phosphate-dependent enzyme [Legionella wadsworthii]STY28772.1 pyridoxal-5'-phosphate dependent enzyme family [Legionella wadsworthii]
MNLYQNLNDIKQLILQTELECNRKPGSTLLLAVSKQQSVESITQLFHLGVTDFGESYFQEAHQKINALRDLPIQWHFIGPIQSNKTKGIASEFSWVHSVNRFKIAQKLSEHRSYEMTPLNICLQINLVEEETKSGIPPHQASKLAAAVSQLPNLRLRGLMTIPPPIRGIESQYQLFNQLKQLMNSVNLELGLKMDTLSMGMSDDLIPAIKAGATIVRIGRGLFGERQK